MSFKNTSEALAATALDVYARRLADARRSPDDAVSLEPIEIPLEEIEIMAARVAVLANTVRNVTLPATTIAERLDAIEKGILAWKNR